jgi:hypothetical protein
MLLQEVGSTLLTCYMNRPVFRTFNFVILSKKKFRGKHIFRAVSKKVIKTETPPLYLVAKLVLFYLVSLPTHIANA